MSDTIVVLTTCWNAVRSLTGIAVVASLPDQLLVFATRLYVMTLQAGQNMLVVTPPVSLLNITVLGSPLTVTVRAGRVDWTRSSWSAVAPPNFVVGSVVTVRITLADGWGNRVTAPAAGQYQEARLGMFGG
jgi:hypothetical protein